MNRRRAGGWLLIVVVPVELGLVGLLIAGVSVADPVRIAVGTIAGAVVLFEFARWFRRYRQHRRADPDRRAAALAATTALVPGLALVAIRWECRVWSGLIRGLLRRPDIPPGATPFTHHRALAPVRWVLATLLVVEMAVVHILVPAGAARLALLVLGLYSLIWLTGYLLGSGPVRPHLVDDHQVVLRSGLTIDVVVPLNIIDRVRAVRHGRAGTATLQVDGRTLSLVDNGGTSLEIVLGVPLTVTLPRRPIVEIDTVCAWVDDPAVMAGAIERAVGPADVRLE